MLVSAATRLRRAGSAPLHSIARKTTAETSDVSATARTTATMPTDHGVCIRILAAAMALPTMALAAAASFAAVPASPSSPSTAGLTAAGPGSLRGSVFVPHVQNDRTAHPSMSQGGDALPQKPRYTGVHPAILATSAVGHASERQSMQTPPRTKTTSADDYYRQHRQIPLPSVMHRRLPDHGDSNGGYQPKILIIGDIHGCYDEMLEIHRKAVEECNDGRDFDYVILVGDLVNKGPESSKVVRHVRSQPNWLSVRGNHDNAALAAALGDETRRKKAKYEWVMRGELAATDNTSVILNDDDVEWMAELPYTITIPSTYFGSDGDGDQDTIVVHAGLLPGIQLQHQNVMTMITMREVYLAAGQYKYNDRETPPGDSGNVGDGATEHTTVPWASIWTGPQRVVFGHDARRGIQRYSGDLAIGIDSGAVYGNGMTGIVLPDRKLVSIPTKQHCPIDSG